MNTFSKKMEFILRIQKQLKIKNMKNKKVEIGLGSIGRENESSELTYNGLNIFLMIQNLHKSWRNIGKHNDEWDELMKDVFIPFLYYIDKSQCLQKHWKEMFESKGFEVEYDENKVKEDVDSRWESWLERFNC